MIFKIFQYFGLLFILLISTFSIIISTSEREVQHKYSYASFLEDRFFDIRMQFNLDTSKTDSQIVLAAIDDISLNKIGRWPWSRAKQAQIVDKLASFGAKILAFDIFYSEPEIACNNESPDLVFKNSLSKFQAIPGNKVILPYSVELKDSSKINEDIYYKEVPDQLLNFMIDTKNAQGGQLKQTLVEKKVFPISILANTDFGISHIEAKTDPDGVFRHYPLVTNVDSFYFPSFALMAYQFFTNEKPILEIRSRDNIFLHTKTGNVFVDSEGETKIRWFGDTTNFPKVSIIDILNAKDNDPKMIHVFKNKIVFVASTAFGANDLRNTPLQTNSPGVLSHMNMTNMLLNGRYFVSEIQSTKISWLLLGIGTLSVIITMLFGNAILDLIAVNFIIFSFLILDTYYLIPHGYNIRLFFCLFSVIACYSWSTFLHFYQSNKDKAKIKGTFSRYLAPSIVNDLLKNPEKVKLGGERKNITVFFSDVRDFTSISEKLTPEQLSHVINKYMTMMTDTLFEHKGTLDKYIGDAMVAYWGAPVELDNHPYWAIKGAIAMIERLPALNQEFIKEGFPEFRHGIGLNTGDCSVGNMGSNQIFSYTALGDSMNLGARLESLCKYYGVQINISEFTKDAIPANLASEFIFRTLDKVQVKGKEKALTIYEVIHPSHFLAKDSIALIAHEAAFEKYLHRKFEDALIAFQALHEKYPQDKSFTRMIETCTKFIEVPPPESWDGTFIHKNK